MLFFPPIIFIAVLALIFLWSSIRILREYERGVVLRVTLIEERMERIVDRVRHRARASRRPTQCFERHARFDCFATGEQLFRTGEILVLQMLSELFSQGVEIHAVALEVQVALEHRGKREHREREQ